jgi:hypothetical protein
MRTKLSDKQQRIDTPTAARLVQRISELPRKTQPETCAETIQNFEMGCRARIAASCTEVSVISVVECFDTREQDC